MELCMSLEMFLIFSAILWAVTICDIFVLPKGWYEYIN